MLITINELSKFSGVYTEEDDTTALSLMQIYIESATQIIADYVGFNPEENEEWEKEIVEQHFVYSSDGVTFYEDDEETKEVSIPVGVDVVLVYGNKYEYDTTTTIIEAPSIFKLVCLEIATLLQLEENSKIGVNTNSFDGVSRTYLNTKNYDLYLKQLSSFRTGGKLEV